METSQPFELEKGTFGFLSFVVNKRQHCWAQRVEDYFLKVGNSGSVADSDKLRVLHYALIVPEGAAMSGLRPSIFVRTHSAVICGSKTAPLFSSHTHSERLDSFFFQMDKEMRGLCGVL